MKNRPNILVVMTDQQAPCLVGALGHPAVKTPHIDKLAARGVAFTQAYCPYPMCTPSRASFMTGQLTPKHNVWELGSPLSSAIPTWAHALRSAGYRTSISGRMHFIGDDQLHGFERRVSDDGYVGVRPFAYDPWLTPITDDHVMLSAVMNSGPTREPTKSELHDKRVCDAAIDELTHLAGLKNADAKPWAMHVGFIQPHAPYAISQPWYDLYDGVEIPVPQNPPNGKSFEENIPAQMIGSRRWLGLTTDGATPRQVQTARRCYYAMVTQIDDLVGQLVGRLTDLGELDNTLILFTSDHGDNHGTHGLWSKLNFFQQSVGIPFVMAGAGLTNQPGRCQAPVSLIDWLPTLLDLTGQTWPADLPGKSLMPLLQNPTETWPGRTVISDYGCGGTRVPIRMVVRDRFKACFAPGFAPVLFDMQNDPDEWHDLGTSPEHQGLISDLYAEARKDGWEPESLLKHIQTEKKVLEYLRSVEGGLAARTRPH